MLLPIPLPYRDEVILNFNTGKTFRLTNDLMEIILRTDDPDLLREFLIERKKSEKFFEYIKKYNQRNFGKIK